MLHLRFRQGRWVLAALLALQSSVSPARADGPETKSPSPSVQTDQAEKPKIQQTDSALPGGKSDTILADFRAAGTKLSSRKSKSDKSDKQDANEADGLTTVEKGSSSNAARKAALAALPLN